MMEEARHAATDSGSRRRMFLRIGIGSAGCALILLVTCTALITFAGSTVREKVFGDPASSWVEAASRVDIAVYEPLYLPPDVGSPHIGIFEPIKGVQEVRAMYPGGLTIEQSTVQSVPEPGKGREPANVSGADESYFVEGAHRTLVVRKGATWVTASALEDEELVRVAESLSPLEE